MSRGPGNSYRQAGDDFLATLHGAITSQYHWLNTIVANSHCAGACCMYQWCMPRAATNVPDGCPEPGLDLERDEREQELQDRRAADRAEALASRIGRALVHSVLEELDDPPDPRLTEIVREVEDQYFKLVELAESL